MPSGLAPRLAWMQIHRPSGKAGTSDVGIGDWGSGFRVFVSQGFSRKRFED